MNPCGFLLTSFVPFFFLRYTYYSDCYWVGSLDFDLLGNRGLSELDPDNFKLFGEGSTATKLWHPRAQWHLVVPFFWGRVPLPTQPTPEKSDAVFFPMGIQKDRMPSFFPWEIPWARLRTESPRAASSIRFGRRWRRCCRSRPSSCCTSWRSGVAESRTTAMGVLGRSPSLLPCFGGGFPY